MAEDETIAAPDGFDGAGERLFISAAGPDRHWAQWISQQLARANYTVEYYEWSWPAGASFVERMDKALAHASRVIAVVSPAYVAQDTYAREEREAALLRTHAREGRLVPVLVAPCQLPPLLSRLSHINLIGLDESAARATLLTRLADPRIPAEDIPFPAAEGTTRFMADPEVAFPELPAVWNVPARLATFTGRQDLLERIHARLHADSGSSGPVAVVQATALHGLGGVGKTQLVVEYAHRYAADYDLVWWVEAEQAPLIGEKIATLASRVGLARTERVTDDATAVLDALRRRKDWLLIFDNARVAEDIRPWLPGGSGHVLITSVNPGWGQLATALEVDILDRAEAVSLLCRRLEGLDQVTADALAAELGDLPLALEQAAAYLEQTRIPAGTYLARFRRNRAQMLTKGSDLAYRGCVDTAWRLALEQLQKTAPAAVQLLHLCAHLGPSPIPLSLLSDRPDLLPPTLDSSLAGDDPVAALDEVIGAALGYSLVRRDGAMLQLHRLVAAAIRAHQTSDARQTSARLARHLLAAALPDEPADSSSWPTWEPLATHLITAPALHPDDPADDIGEDGRDLLVTARRYMAVRSEYPAACNLDHVTYERCQRIWAG
jgi:hypothetical protein